MHPESAWRSRCGDAHSRVKLIYRGSLRYTASVEAAADPIYNVLLQALTCRFCSTTHPLGEAWGATLHGLSRADLCAALLRVPLVCKAFAAIVDAADKKRHHAILSYERFRCRDADSDNRWFLAPFSASVSLVEGPTSVHLTDDCTHLARSRFSMLAIDEVLRHAIDLLEGQGQGRVPVGSGFTIDGMREGRSSDLPNLPREIRIFIAFCRALLQKVGSDPALVHERRFARCGHRACGRVFYIGAAEDAYGVGADWVGRELEILPGVAAPGNLDWHGRDSACARQKRLASRYWIACLSSFTLLNPFRKFCCRACYSCWTDDLRGALCTKGIDLEAEPDDAALGARGADRIPAALDAALKRNARVARRLRDQRTDAPDGRFSEKVLQKQLEGVVQTLNVDVAVLMAAMEQSNGTASVCERHLLPGAAAGWRHGPGHLSHLELARAIAAVHRRFPTDRLITSLGTRPVFLMHASCAAAQAYAQCRGRTRGSSANFRPAREQRVATTPIQ